MVSDSAAQQLKKNLRGELVLPGDAVFDATESRRAATHAKQVEALRKWNPEDLPKWLDEDFYQREILPRLSPFTVKTIRQTIDVSHPYARLIKRGDRIPHPRHWLELAKLTHFIEK